MQTLTEKRVFGSKFGTTELFVASETGLVAVSISADQIGEFGLAHRGPVQAVAADQRGVLIGTDDGVLHSSPETETDAGTAQSRTFSPLDGFGNPVAVGWGPERAIAVDASGTVVTHAVDNGDWTTVGELDGVRAVDGDLLAATDGVYRLDGDGLSHVGLSDVRDVASHGTPLAATADGLFALGNGWQRVREGAFDRVASDGHAHAHAVGSSGLLRRTDEADSAAEGWTADEL
ncbi:MAG: HVO_0234 family beta-propeller protein, partial [Halohasta sp.]